ncbi:MAG: hypothetical protein WC516_00400 [Patescibacteria group bacterium]
MPDINLLPEDLRIKEQKELEKAAKRPKIFEVELNNPIKDPMFAKESDKTKKSFWAKLFGTKEKTKVPTVLNNLPPSQQSNPGIDLLLASRKSQTSYKSSAQTGQLSGSGSAQKNSGSFAWPKILGQPSSPFKPVASQSKNGNYGSPSPALPKAPATAENKNVFSSVNGPMKPPITPAKLPPPTQPKGLPYKAPKVKTSFWGLLKNWFGAGNSTAVKEPRFAPVAPPPANRPEVRGPLSVNKIKTDWHAEQQVSHHLDKDRLAATGSTAGSDAKKYGHLKYHLAPKMEKGLTGVNLMPEEFLAKKQLSTGQQLAIFLFVVVFSSGVVYGSSLIISHYQSQVDQSIAAKQQEAITLTKQIKALQVKKQQNINFQNKILSLKDILGSHIYWTKFFGLLEKYTIDNVFFTGFSADSSGQISLPALADSYESAAKQIVALRQASDFIKDVNVDSIQLSSQKDRGITGVSFNLKITLIDDVFYKR